MKLAPTRLKNMSNKKIALLSLLLVVVVAGSLAAYNFWGKDKNKPNPGDINYGPPTAEEKKETDEFKQGLGNQQSQPNQQTSPPPGQKKTANVFISSWGQPSGANVEVSGYVTGVYEEGGTCTATLEKDGQKVTGSRAATINAQNISCGFVVVERSKLSPGPWKATLSYASASAEGSSQPVTVEVK